MDEPRRRCGGLRRDDGAQLMLLAGVLLVLGVIGVLAIASQLQNTRDGLAAAGEGTDADALLALAAVSQASINASAADHGAGNQAHQDDVAAIADHLEHLARAQGLYVRISPTFTCQPVGAPATWTTWFNLTAEHDGGTVTLPVSHISDGGASC
ncbi:MAG: hypothetical protein ACPGQL_08555 [Thermoplasmatota archaeon]